MISNKLDSFHTHSKLEYGGRTYDYFALPKLALDLGHLPYSIKILLENLLRHEDGRSVQKKDIQALMAWNGKGQEISFMPSRVILQDFTGVPAIADLAALREAMKKLGGDPKKINPLLPSELVIDHSVQVDYSGTPEAYAANAQLEFERNRERYTFLRWGQLAFTNLKIVPPDTGIVHQINLEYLGRVVFEKDGWLYPDSLVGTDSHTTMINALGVLGWGVGGIEAEAAMLGQPLSFLIPEVIGVRLSGKLSEGTTATDLVLTITEVLRKKGVVEKFVEFFGPGLGKLTLADRATLSNMSPEFGSTCAIFPIDEKTLEYLRLTGRPEKQVGLIEAYAKAQGIFHDRSSPEPRYTEVVSIDLATIQASLAGPKRPQDRVSLTNLKTSFQKTSKSISCQLNGENFELRDGSLVIAAITSCTNTSNPALLIAAGLVAKNAVERGLSVKPWVKTSLAPGSMVVTEYLTKAGLTPFLNDLKFHLVGYGCTTCIGNSGPLADPIAKAIQESGIVAAAILSGNRNFEGRIHPQVRANYLASPPLVVAFALVGRIDWDPSHEPIGKGKDKKNIFLKDIWPTNQEVTKVLNQCLDPKMFQEKYATVFDGDDNWKALQIPKGDAYLWEKDSTYIRCPSFFDDLSKKPVNPGDLTNARVLAIFGDSVTTDHISPAGSIKPDSPAGKYLQDHGIKPSDFNSYGSRRGNHEVMVRGTFANIRIRNQMLPGVEGGLTRHFPDEVQQSIFDVAMLYQKEGVPLIVLAGKEYGSGSSRDWAAKGPRLLGVRAVIAESFERIHRSNLVGMGILPLEFLEHQNTQSLGFKGDEMFSIRGISSNLSVRKILKVVATKPNGEAVTFDALARLDTPVELDYYRHGGILPFVLRQLL